MQQQTPRKNYTLELILAWSFVGIPLAWGVIQTCINAAKLFSK
ncbi:MAG TPA: hypothetical protein VKV77_09290 [Methylovirgula sp.]|nr:hypothetical protein [Methylovirgula sp.]